MSEANKAKRIAWYKKYPLFILGLIGWILKAILTVVFFPLRPFAARVSSDHNRVWCTSFPKVMYIWPFLPGCLLANAALELGWASPGFLGWCFVAAIFLMIISLAEDLNAVAAIVLALIIGLVFAFAHIAKLQWNVPVLQEVFDYFRGLNVLYTTGIGYAMAWIVGILLVAYGFPRAWIDGRHEMTTRGIAQVKYGRRAELTPSAGRVITVAWPDVLEFLIGFGAGSVIIKDRAGHVIKHVDNVFGLWFIHKNIENVFEALGIRNQNEEELNAIVAGDDNA